MDDNTFKLLSTIAAGVFALLQGVVAIWLWKVQHEVKAIGDGQATLLAQSQERAALKEGELIGRDFARTETLKLLDPPTP